MAETRPTVAQEIDALRVEVIKRDGPSWIADRLRSIYSLTASVGECGALIPYAWHEQILCELPAGHDGLHWCEDTGWEQ